jgi:hypothetical protein
VLQAALNGAGVCALPMDLAAPYLRIGQLRRVLSPWITARFTLYAAMPSRVQPARARLSRFSDRTHALDAGRGRAHLAQPFAGAPGGARGLVALPAGRAGLGRGRSADL